MPAATARNAPETMAEAVEAIHRGTAIYTHLPEIDALLDRLDWPTSGRRLLDPGAGDGGLLVAALARLDLRRDDVETATQRVHGYEFHPGAVEEARTNVETHLSARGWSRTAARRAAAGMVEQRDYLLSPIPVGVYDVVAANPPYWRFVNLPPAYREEYVAAVAPHARGDLLHAFLQRSADIVAPGGRIGLVTSDRWLLNDGSAELRRRIGERFTVRDVVRLESASAFYRPKSRRKGTPARVHPVSLVLTPDATGRPLASIPFAIEEMPAFEGTPLGDLAEIRLAPWLGPDGIFVVREAGAIPAHRLVPCVEPEDVHPTEDRLRGHTRWAISTDRETPEKEVLAHLDEHLHRMPARGRRDVRWLPPETFSHKFPVVSDAILVPRIATRLRPILLPAGTMPVNHNLVVVSGIPASTVSEWLSHPLVQRQADALALRVESGYRSYTANLLRRLTIPDEVVPASLRTRS